MMLFFWYGSCKFKNKEDLLNKDQLRLGLNTNDQSSNSVKFMACRDQSKKDSVWKDSSRNVFQDLFSSHK